ncbi:Ribosome-binding protein 1 [Babesia ovata]|uniref:Ribosome-binding protein 1 n=1 Tax=Babesia ovata TaxID=189622 RepID=A0A2H6KBC8_9APIC|nr:Ribosome-binding protein 1 [Babesia ovata]GBE60298.1 Ribosome-binding protein 1 [Babesia ovata]
MAKNAVALSTLKDCLQFLEWLRNSSQGKTMKGLVAHRLERLLKEKYKGVNQNDIESALSTFLTNVHTFHTKICKSANQSNNNPATAKTALNALLECVPKLLSVIYFLKYQVDEGFKALGGGEWASEMVGWVALFAQMGQRARTMARNIDKYLISQSGSEYGIMPGGFAPNELKSGHLSGYSPASAMVKDLQSIMEKHAGRNVQNYFLDVYSTSVIPPTSGAETPNVANALRLVQDFCRIFGGLKSVEELRSHLYTKDRCINLDELKKHCATLNKSLGQIFTKNHFSFTGYAREDRFLNDQNIAKKMASWLKKNLREVRKKLENIEAFSTNKLKININQLKRGAKLRTEQSKALHAYFTNNFIPHGFTFYAKQFTTKEAPYELLEKKWSAAIVILNKPDDGLEKLKKILDGESCPNIKPEEDEELLEEPEDIELKEDGTEVQIPVIKKPVPPPVKDPGPEAAKPTADRSEATKTEPSPQEKPPPSVPKKVEVTPAKVPEAPKEVVPEKKVPVMPPKKPVDAGPNDGQSAQDPPTPQVTDSVLPQSPGSEGDPGPQGPTGGKGDRGPQGHASTGTTASSQSPDSSSNQVVQPQQHLNPPPATPLLPTPPSTAAAPDPPGQPSAKGHDPGSHGGVTPGLQPGIPPAPALTQPPSVSGSGAGTTGDKGPGTPGGGGAGQGGGKDVGQDVSSVGTTPVVPATGGGVGGGVGGSNGEDPQGPGKGSPPAAVPPPPPPPPPLPECTLATLLNPKSRNGRFCEVKSQRPKPITSLPSSLSNEKIEKMWKDAQEERILKAFPPKYPQDIQTQGISTPRNGNVRDHAAHSPQPVGHVPGAGLPTPSDVDGSPAAHDMYGSEWPWWYYNLPDVPADGGPVDEPPNPEEKKMEDAYYKKIHDDISAGINKKASMAEMQAEEKKLIEKDKKYAENKLNSEVRAQEIIKRIEERNAKQNEIAKNHDKDFEKTTEEIWETKLQQNVEHILNDAHEDTQKRLQHKKGAQQKNLEPQKIQEPPTSPPNPPPQLSRSAPGASHQPIGGLHGLVKQYYDPGEGRPRQRNMDVQQDIPNNLIGYADGVAVKDNTEVKLQKLRDRFDVFHNAYNNARLLQAQQEKEEEDQLEKEFEQKQREADEKWKKEQNEGKRAKKYDDDVDRIEKVLEQGKIQLAQKKLEEQRRKEAQRKYQEALKEYKRELQQQSIALAHSFDGTPIEEPRDALQFPYDYGMHPIVGGNTIPYKFQANDHAMEASRLHDALLKKRKELDEKQKALDEELKKALEEGEEKRKQAEEQYAQQQIMGRNSLNEDHLNVFASIAVAAPPAALSQPVMPELGGNQVMHPTRKTLPSLPPPVPERAFKPIPRVVLDAYPSSVVPVLKPKPLPTSPVKTPDPKVVSADLDPAQPPPIGLDVWKRNKLRGLRTPTPYIDIHVPKLTLTDNDIDFNLDVDDDPPPPTAAEPLDPIGPFTPADVALNFPPIESLPKLPDSVPAKYIHTPDAVEMCVAPWLTQKPTHDPTDIPETELFPSEAPRTVRDMLVWLAGLQHPKHQETLKECINNAFKRGDHDPSDLLISVNNSNITAKDVIDTIHLAAVFAASVLTSIEPNWRVAVSSVTSTRKDSDQSKDPDCCALLCHLRDYAYASHHQLTFLKSQCSRDKLNGGWQDCQYGQDAKTPSPLQAFLTDALESKFKTHLFDPCGICLKSRVKMGFTKDDLPASQQTGKHLHTILTPSCGGEDPLLTLSSYLNCLTRRTPRTTGELVSFFHNFGEVLHKGDTKVMSSLGISISTQHDKCPEWDRLDPKDLQTIKKFRGADACEHDNDHPNTLSTLLGCGKKHDSCVGHFTPITHQAYGLYSPSFAYTYFIWTVYLADKLHDSLERLYMDFENHVTKCESLDNCADAMPLLYYRGFTPPEGIGQSSLKCSDVISKLQVVLSGQPIASLITAMDTFLYRVRAPFLFTIIALWLTATLYIAHSLLYRMDVLRIRSHLLTTTASHLIDVKALLTHGRKLLSLYNDVDYFDDDPVDKLDIT